MSKTNPLEKDIEYAVSNYARQCGFLSYKFVSPAQRSVPDRIFIAADGRVFFVEFKRAGCLPTDAQYHTINKMRERGAAVFVIDNIDSGKLLIDSYVDAIV
jgi:hypothetical protein